MWYCRTEFPRAVAVSRLGPSPSPRASPTARAPTGDPTRAQLRADGHSHHSPGKTPDSRLYLA